MKKVFSFLGGILTGIINVLLGAGGGVIAVFLLKKCSLDQKQAQANALAVILPISVISLIIYSSHGYVNFFDNLLLIPQAAVGAVLGTAILKKISPKISKKLFGAFMIWAGIRMLVKI